MARAKTTKRKPTARRRTARASKRALVTKLLESALEQVEEKKVRASLADVIRLLQMKSEVDSEPAREIEVRWVEPPPDESAGEK